MHTLLLELGMYHLGTAEELVQSGWTMLDVMEQNFVLMIVIFLALGYPVVPIIKMPVLFVQVYVCVCVHACAHVYVCTCVCVHYVYVYIYVCVVM